MCRLCKSIALVALWALVVTAEQTHNNNWAVIVCTSRFWFNYRHVANALSVYYLVKQLGIPDSNIILMLADDMPCNARNPHPGEVFHDESHSLNIYGEEVEVDYRGGDVTVQNFIGLLSGRTAPGTPASKKLLSDENSNILIYMTGHGGDGYLKFQDREEIQSQEFAFVVEEMHLKRKYHEMLIMVDTCGASTLFDYMSSPNIVTVASSAMGESSYSHGADHYLGLSIIDKFTKLMLDFFREHDVSSGTLSPKVTLADLFFAFDPKSMLSTTVVKQVKMARKPANIPVTDFFGSVIKPTLAYEGYPLL